jgi:hypothetical protein
MKEDEQIGRRENKRKSTNNKNEYMMTNVKNTNSNKFKSNDKLSFMNIGMNKHLFSPTHNETETQKVVLPKNIQLDPLMKSPNHLKMSNNNNLSNIDTQGNQGQYNPQMKVSFKAVVKFDRAQNNGSIMIKPSFYSNSKN